MNKPMPTTWQRRLISVESHGLDDRTIRRCYVAPDAVLESTWLRVADAARKLRLPSPPRRAD